jgi:cysteinyl-tRNA synthetase
MLRVYNSLARELQEFVPIRPGEVRMYVCGMTVYDYCHLGHARMLVAFDMVQRWLRAKGFRVTYVRNITDIDDKIIRRALEEKTTVTELTGRFIRLMHEDLAALGAQKPDHEPRATQYVPQMLDLIGRLQENGLAYQAQSGDVNFSVRKFPGYGKLSGKSLDELRAGERVEVDATKQDPLDFVLWKRSKPEEPKWPSAWGEGRPGWHIECSAMSCALLGEQFDIHGGGQDLQFPHHENEIAQSEGASGRPLANYWLHNGFLRLDNEKMSKSLGNFFTIRDILKSGVRPEVLRYLLVRSHYRSPINYGDAQLEDAEKALTRLYTALRNHPIGNATIDWNEPHAQRFAEAMDDDFGTPKALAALFDLASEIGRGRADLAPQLRALGAVLGIVEGDPEDFLQKRARGEGAHTAEDYTPAGFTKSVKELIQERNEARARKDYAEADRVRAALNNAGVILEDAGGKTTWRRR